MNYTIENRKHTSLLKLIIILSSTLILLLSFSISSSAKTDIRLGVSSSPSSLPAFYIEQNINDIKLETNIHRSRNVAISRLMKKEVDAALLSTNEAAKLYNKGIDVKIAGIHTWGIFYLLSSRKDIENWDDLKDKEIYVPDKGGTLDIVFQELLQKNNLDTAKDLKIQRGKMREVAQLMINDMAEVAVIREPYVSQTLLNNNNTEIVFDLQEEWSKVYSFKIPQSALVFRAEFAEEHPELVDKLEENYMDALKQLKNDKDAAADLGQQFLEVEREIILESYARLNLEYQSSSKVKDDIESYLQTLMNYSKDTIGGSIPDERFYIEN